MLDAAGGSLDGRRGQAYGAALRHDDAMRANRHSGTDNRTQVMRVSHAIQDNQEGILLLASSQLQHILHGGILISGRKSDHPLVIAGQLVQANALHHLHGHMSLVRHGDDLPRGAGQIALSHHQFFDIAAGLERLADGVAAGQQVFIEFFLHRLRRARNRRGSRSRGCGAAIVAALLGTLLRIGTALVFAAIAVFTAITVWLARTEITGIAGAILLAVAAVIAAAVILAVHVHLLTVAASLGLKTAVLRAFVSLACILAHMILLGHMLFVHVIKVSH